ncbi:solute carrier family 23 protein, partial [Metabacillus fastidiosus]
MKKQASSNLIVGVDEKIGVGRAFLLGLQHVLAMDLYIVPIIIAGILAMDTGNTAFLIQMSFLAAGIATLIQTGKGIKLPVMQGPSYIPIGALTAIGSKLGLGAMIGSLIPGAIIIALFGYPLKWFAKLVQRFIPAIVGGTVIAVVGISLMPVAMTGIFTVQGNVQHGII